MQIQEIKNLQSQGFEFSYDYNGNIMKRKNLKLKNDTITFKIGENQIHKRTQSEEQSKRAVFDNQ